ncbi:ABC-2 family transporter protein [Kitasatospora sp. GP82]|uniref:ABC transporter permease n=1 Tax=Kitasatospora sp. GP82 TaxID=3035089 RepID=UPI00247550C4|nr:ABC-2 family transporter protein [Kitasatospora sp. GP82]MDH6126620.1 ABC-2 type transport system permease protein [Kitasatospora sp. GP82]
MAELLVPEPQVRGPEPQLLAPETRMARVRWALRSWRLVAAMWTRATMAYRASFYLMFAASIAATSLDFVVLLLMFQHTDSLGGWSLPELGFLYGTSGLCLGLANLLVGSADALGDRIRTGTLDTMLIRPAPALAQLCAERFSLRRLGRPLQAASVLAWSLTELHVRWTADRVLLVPVLLVCGTVIFGAVYIGGATLQFWWGEVRELQNSLTYGGATLIHYPPTIFAKELVAGVVFGIPLAFVNWLPSLRILGKPDPLGLPTAFQYASPIAAALCVLAAALAWRAGLRAYRGTGN